MDYATDQQATPKNPPVGVAVWDLVRQDLDARRKRLEAPTPIIDAVYREAGDRDAFGRAKYGVPLKAMNGRDSLTDALQEAMDLSAYLKCAVEEFRVAPNDLRLRQLYDDAILLMLRLRGLIFERDGR